MTALKPLAGPRSRPRFERRAGDRSTPESRHRGQGPWILGRASKRASRTNAAPHATPLLGRRGIVIFQSEVGRAMFDDDNVIAVEYAFTVAHVSGETWPHVLRQTGVSTCRNTKGGWDDKSLNKCHTAARKYFLLALFQIPTGDEEDADQGDRRPAPAQVPAVVHRVRSVAPEYVVPPPSRSLKPGGIAERAITKRYEQAVRGPSQPFVASEAGKVFSPRFRAPGFSPARGRSSAPAWRLRFCSLWSG